MRLLLLMLLLFFTGCRDRLPTSPITDASPLIQSGDETNTTLEENLSQKPQKTITFFVHGYHKEGSEHHGIFGEAVINDMLVKLRHYTRWPILTESNTGDFGHALASCWYYGDTPPSYYSAEDIREIEKITTEFGGGIPRYAAILGKFIDHMMQKSHADKANIVSVSMGSLVTRWLIEKDISHLASSKKIARWLSLEGVIAGNYAASADRIVDLTETFDPQSIDVAQMRYDWIEKHLHTPAFEAASPYYGDIMSGFESSTDDHLNSGGLSLLTKLNGGYRPNDGTQLVEDTYFRSILPQSKYRGLPPMHLFFHENHFSLEQNDGAYTSIVAFLEGTRRLRITLVEAQVDDIHEGRTLFFNFRPAEVVFASRIYSPLAARKWQVRNAIDERALKSGILPIHKYDHDHQNQTFSQILFDSLVLPEEENLTLDLHAYEIDYDERYHMQELTGHRDEDLGGAEITLPLRAGIYDIAGKNWSGKVLVERLTY